MAYLVGFALAALTFLFARGAGFDRDGAFYPVVLVVIASYYVLFAVMGGSTNAIIIESVVTAIFAAVAVIGFRLSPWIVAAALAAHGVFDWIHGSLISNPGVPEWWPAFCAAFDTALAAGFSWLILQRKRALAWGTVATASDSMIVVTTLAGDIRVAVSSPLEVYSRGPAELSEVTASSFVGVTSVAQPDGSQNATEIHIFPEALRGTNEGTFLMRQQPGAASPSTMTNGTVQPPRMTNGTASGVTGGKLVVDYRAGTQTITVPSGITVTKISLTETKLAPGSNVVVLARKRPDGTLTASRVLLAGGQ